MYTVLGASGNIGSVISRKLLEQGEKVRVVGRRAGALQQFVQRGAEAVLGDITNADLLTEAFTGARAAFLMIPPVPTSTDYRADQDRMSEAIAAAVKNSGLKYAVLLSSYGAQAPSGTGPIAGLHFTEKKLDAIPHLNVLHLRAAYFMENSLTAIGMIQMMGIFGGAIKADLKTPMIATRDVGAYAAERLLKLDFSGKETRELLGERDLCMNEVASTISRALNRADLRYAQFPYDQVEQVFIQMGTSPKTAALYVEMFRAINDGIVAPLEERTAENTTPTSIETFVKQVFVPAFQGQAVGA
jgi:uncharacterized protein YbjT (DUF2867 family)